MMSGTVTVNLDRPIESVRILDNYKGSASCSLSQNQSQVNSGADAEQTLMQGLEAQKAELSQACQVLKGVITKLNQFYDEIFAGHREEIAKLSVEIARKILVQKVENGDYQIESIVKEALKTTPACQDVVVHLNPEDHLLCQKLQQDEPNGILAGIKFVSDPNIGRAECLLETPKGIVESLIEEHLRRIGKALTKVE